MAVTHSRGKGLSEPIPGSDLAFEKAQWRRHREDSSKQGTKPQSDDAGNGSLDEDIMEALSEPHSELDFLIPAGSTGKETFHSMADIASCSYEARKVREDLFVRA